MEPLEQIDRTAVTMEAAIRGLRAQGIDMTHVFLGIGETCGRIAKVVMDDTVLGALLLDNLAAALKSHAEDIRSGSPMFRATQLVDPDQQR